MTVIIGVDPQLRRLAAVIRKGDCYRLYEKTYTGETIAERTYHAYRWMRQILLVERLAEKEIAVYIEEPFVGFGKTANVKTGLDLAKVHGALLASCGALSVPAFPVNNQHWKHEVIGKGKIDKTMIADYVAESWKDLYNEIQEHHKSVRQDLCDAAGIAEYGLRNWDKDKTTVSMRKDGI